MLITLDMETYFDDDYTLKKMSTSEYVRDKRFEALCVGIKEGKKKTVVYWGKDIAPKLKKLKLENHEVLCHHAQFDLLVLSHHFQIFPGKARCTLSMARALRPRTLRNGLDAVALAFGRGSKIKGTLDKAKGRHVADFSVAEKKEIGLYCAQDVNLTYVLYTQDMLPGYPPKELEVIDLIVKLFTDPVLELDMPRARKELEREATERQKAIDNSGMSLEDITKNKLFAAKLVELGIEPPMKISKTPPYKTIHAFAQTDLEFIALKDHTDVRVAQLVKGRLAAKSTIGGTRIARMIASGKVGALPIYINYCGTHVLRGSGGDKCLAGSTEIDVLRKGQNLCIMLSQLKANDLVWDGEEYVAHDGLIDNGYAGVIAYEGILGTPDHKVYCKGKKKPVKLSTAWKSNYKLETGQYPFVKVETPTKNMPSSKRPMCKPRKS